jgi:hypothetical protein
MGRKGDLKFSMKLPNTAISRVKAAFAPLDLGDPRRTRRLEKVVEKLASRPSASLPNALGTEPELEGAYRLANNAAVEPQALFDAYAATTAQRASQAGKVIVIHDTTKCGFAHADGKEVGFLSTGKPGFYLHTSLVVDGTAWRRPLGVAYVETLVRKQVSKRGRKNKASGAETARWKNRESLRWERSVAASGRLLGYGELVVHVMDREGDSYGFFAPMVVQNQVFVARVNHDRVVGDPEDLAEPWVPIKTRTRALEGMFDREVPLSRRKGSSAPRDSASHPPRKARLAHLTFSATTVVLRRPRYLSDPIPATLTLNVVCVSEPNPPQGEPAVEWLLYTPLPVETAQQVAEVVDIYRARWTTEEFYKALKTGCAYESREFETLHALLVILALSLPIACELLWLRSRARTQPDAPATEVLTPRQLEIVREMGTRRLPPEPTARDALWAVAGLGGHQKRNGEPGWLVLYRGMQKLLDFEAGWVAGFKAGRRSGWR